MIPTRCTKLLLRTTLAALALLATNSAAQAGTITFFDTPSLFSVTLSPDLIARGSTFTCSANASAETCTVTVLPPTNPYSGGSGWTNWTILEPGTNLISDEIQVTPTFGPGFNATSFQIVFTSYATAIAGTPTGNVVYETGAVQSVGGGVSWFPSSGTVLDSIYFQSQDGPVVPEPATSALLGAGFVALGIIRRRQRN